jgi:hypothetical protein
MVYVFIWLVMLMFALSAVLALVWSINNGQLRNLEKGSLVIFDAGEPVGQMTDAFPRRSSSGSHDAVKSQPTVQP